eukprot:151987_1
MNKSPYKTNIEYISIDKERKDVRVFGSWDKFTSDTELKYQGRQIFVAIALIPAGSHHFRFLINGKKWDTNFFCNRVVMNGIMYNAIEVKPNNKQNKLDTTKIQNLLWNKYDNLIQFNQQRWSDHVLFNKQMNDFLHDNTIPHLQKPLLLIYGFIRSINVIIPQSIIVLCFRFWQNNKTIVAPNIYVSCRIRPFLRFELEKGFTSTLDETRSNENILLIQNDQGKIKEFNYFHKLYESQTTQIEIFEDMQYHLNDILKGRNITIFVYGQIGSGKTYTLEGSKENPGILMNSLQFIFNKITQNKNIRYIVKCAIFEIFHDKICNLLVSKDYKTNNKNKIKIQHLSNGQVIFKNLQWFTIESVETFQILMDSAKQKRTNDFQMRGLGNYRGWCHTVWSHMCYLFEIVGVDILNGITYIGKLNCVDLAGADRQKKNAWGGVNGGLRKAAQTGHKTFWALCDVLASVQRKEKLIPYGNSTLTDMLENSIGGHATVMMYLNICPGAGSCFETINTVKRGKYIVNAKQKQNKQKPEEI